MRHSIALLINAVLLWGVPAAVCGVTELRDIREPIFTHGLPPFVLTATALILGGLLLVLLCRRKQLSDATDHVPGKQQLPADSLSRLGDDYRQGSISSEVLFGRLAILINRHLTACAINNATSFTTSEILQYVADANLLNPQNTINAARLLQLCDMVKFADHHPSETEIAWALESAAGILMSDTGKSG